MNKLLIESLGVTLYMRDGRWYWMIKSESFDTAVEALKDAEANLGIMKSPAKHETSTGVEK